MLLAIPPALTGSFVLDPFKDRTIEAFYAANISGGTEGAQLSFGMDTLLPNLPAPQVIAGTAPAVGESLLNTNMGANTQINITGLKITLKKGTPMSYSTGAGTSILVWFS